MDAFVTGRQASTRSLTELIGRPITPPEEGLDMPPQRFDRGGPAAGVDPSGPDRATLVARAVLLALTLAITGYGVWEMAAVVGTDATLLQTVFVALFALSFGWIAFSAANALIGFAVIAASGYGHSALRDDEPLPGRTALVMPIFNEDTDRVFDGLKRMAREVTDAGRGGHFEMFVLSDTTDMQVAWREDAAARRLRHEFEGSMEIFYRRREANTARKAGNITDFVRRWGNRYDHMIVLDADSYMSAAAMTSLVAAMQADPNAGLIQTNPRLHNRNTLFARMLQFATAVYGPLVAAGLSLWHGRDGNFWGHNAIIRMRAFAEACGLPELTGRKPFGGYILSHDFVEAALLRRAGWSVYMRPDLQGSYEEAPPALADFAKRDRRWAQGNMQHAKILPSAGLHWMSRLHLLNGIMSYLASVIWLAFLLTGFALALQATMVLPDYFPPDHEGLFPRWPTFDAERALWLMGFAGAVLLLPKLLGLLTAICDGPTRRAAGGAGRLSASVVLEIAISALMAPVMMLIQTASIVEILLARDSGWLEQRRGDGKPRLRTAVLLYAPHTLAGIVLALGSAIVAPVLWLWLLPVWLGLCLAIPIGHLTSLKALGEAARRAGLFLTPEDTAATSGPSEGSALRARAGALTTAPG